MNEWRLPPCRALPAGLFTALILTVLPASVTYAQQSEGRWKGFVLVEGGGGEFEVEADRLVSRENGSILLEGNVKVRGTAFLLHCDWLEISPGSEVVVAEGGVELVEGNSVLHAERLELDRKLGRAIAELVRIEVNASRKNGKAPKGVTGARKLLEIESRRLTYEKRRYLLDGGLFTTCDCGEDEAPSWQVQSCRARVEPEEGAWLEWPVLRVKGVPVFAFPIAYLPLARRRSGLLLPRVNYSGRDGFVVGDDLFLVFGRSADATIGIDWFEERGLRYSLEFRARPSASSSISLQARYLDDDKLGADERTSAIRKRFSIEADAWWNDAETEGVVDVELFSDTDFPNDFISDVAGRAGTESVSAARLELLGSSFRLEGDAAWRQDLRWPHGDLLANRTQTELRDDTIQRLGAVALDVPEIPVSDWPVYFSGRIELANISSLSAAWRDWGTDGLPDAFEPRWAADAGTDPSRDNEPYGGEGNGLLDAGEIRRAARMMVEPGITAVLFGAGMGFEFSARHRQLLYLPHGPQAPRPSTRGLTVLNACAWTDLQRRFTSAGLLHRIRPGIRLAGSWRGLESGGPPAYMDLYDRQLVDAQQALFELANLLVHGPSGLELDMVLYQGLDLRSPGIGPGGFELSLRSDWAKVEASLGLDVSAAAATDARASAGFRFGGFVKMHLDYLWLNSKALDSGVVVVAAERYHRNPDLPLAPELSPLVSVGKGIHVFQGTVSAELGSFSLVAAGLVDLAQKQWTWISGGLGYDSPCNCWGIFTTVRFAKGQDFPDVFVLLDLGVLGTLKTGTNQRF